MLKQNCKWGKEAQDKQNRDDKSKVKFVAQQLNIAAFY